MYEYMKFTVSLSIPIEQFVAVALVSKVIVFNPAPHMQPPWLSRRQQPSIFCCVHKDLQLSLSEILIDVFNVITSREEHV